MKREIKFRALVEYIGKEPEWVFYGTDDKPNFVDMYIRKVIYQPLIEDLQYTGLKDKNGKEIYEGDIVRIRRPFRSTQTHTGNNIPNGSYTEPMEPEIEVIEEEVVFTDGMFTINDNQNTPLIWLDSKYDEDSLKEAIAFRGKDIFDWNGEEGDLIYLLEKYNAKSLEELLSQISGIEVIGNIYQTPELLQ